MRHDARPGCWHARAGCLVSRLSALDCLCAMPRGVDTRECEGMRAPCPRQQWKGTGRSETARRNGCAILGYLDSSFSILVSFIPCYSTCLVRKGKTLNGRQGGGRKEKRETPDGTRDTCLTFLRLSHKGRQERIRERKGMEGRELSGNGRHATTRYIHGNACHTSMPISHVNTQRIHKAMSDE